MKKILRLFCSTTILLATSCGTHQAYFPDAICIQNIATIDPIEGLKNNQTVIISEGKIIKIMPSDEITLSNENEIIDGDGKYLMPGLWDTHVHFAYIEDIAPRMFTLFLANGVTSVRDTGGNVNFVKEWKDKSLLYKTDAPRVMMAGPLLDGEPNVYDGADPAHPELSVELHSLEDITSQVQLLIDKNVDLLKAYEMLSPKQFKKINELAKANGLKVTGHVPLSMDVVSAAEAGLSSMEHLRNLELSCATNSDELLESRRKMLMQGKNMTGGELRSAIHAAQKEEAIKNYNEAEANKVLTILKKYDVWQIPTLALNTFLSNQYYANDHYQKSYQYLPDSIAQYWKKRSVALKEYPINPSFEAQTNFNKKMIKKIHDFGIPIMAGTDTPIAYLTPGRSLHVELEALVNAGLSPLEAIKTATYNPAKYFNMEKELGSIKENMWADLIILNSNPLEDINNTLHINTVLKNGKVHNASAIDSMLNKLKAK